MKKLILIAALLAYLPTAYGQTQEVDIEYYAGFSVGNAKTNTLIVNGDEINGTYKVFIGTNVKKNIDLEIHHGNKILNIDFKDGTSTKSYTYGVAAIYQVPQKDFIPFTKIGYHQWKTESATAGKTDGSDPFYGVGITKEIAGKVSIRAEIEYFQYADDNVKYYSIGVQRKF
jgi:hypothetical protein